MHILLLATGGTFDKEYNELNGELFFRDTHLSKMLDLGRSRLDVRVEKLMMIDSLDMTDDQRRAIMVACREAPESHIVITHGTDTMVETAAAIAAGDLDKTIVITGAMVPYHFGSSDGMFNLGSALALVQSLPPGVYVAMNGEWFLWDNVRKNREEGVFEELDG